MTERTNAEWKQLAQETARWMKEIGAVHDSGKRHRSYVTNEDWAKEFEALHGVQEDEMGTMVQHAHSMGLWIGFVEFKGWYLGESESDAASVSARLINYAITLLNTVGLYLDAGEESGHMSEILTHLQPRVRKIGVDGIVPLMGAAGRELADGLEQKLLEARDKLN